MKISRFKPLTPGENATSDQHVSLPNQGFGGRVELERCNLPDHCCPRGCPLTPGLGVNTAPDSGWRGCHSSLTSNKTAMPEITRNLKLLSRCDRKCFNTPVSIFYIPVFNNSHTTRCQLGPHVQGQKVMSSESA